MQLPLHRIALRIGAAALAAVLAACAPQGLSGPETQALASHGVTEEGLQRVAARMDPAARSLAMRHDPGLRRTDYWARPVGWETLDISNPPSLGFATAEGESAQEINELRPFSHLPIRAMRPFVLKADASDSARALKCLTEAIYYESAREPAKGQAAVAQVVLNRLRHPAYPKSVCGVVYQGAARTTGCQFTFTCDGSLRWAPQPALWRQAEDVARRALAGFVDKQVGSATHYHAAYVAPYWAPTLVKMTQVGQHIFYRWTGPWGEPPAFIGRYAGREDVLPPSLLESFDARTQGGLLAPERQNIAAEKKIVLSVAGEVRTYQMADPNASGGQRTRVMGVLQPTRRKPTPEEVREINAKLEAMEAGQTAAPAAAAPAS